MSRCAFDRNAITLTPPEARRLLRSGGFEILRTDFRFIFPRALRALRKIEDVGLSPAFRFAISDPLLQDSVTGDGD